MDQVFEFCHGQIIDMDVNGMLFPLLPRYLFTPLVISTARELFTKPAVAFISIRGRRKRASLKSPLSTPNMAIYPDVKERSQVQDLCQITIPFQHLHHQVH